MKYLITLSLIFQLFTFSAVAQQYKYHIVERGETVTSIARDYNISVETLFTYNPDAKAGISVNTKLVVPVKSTAQKGKVDFKEHKVKRKETLFSLSQEYNVSVEDIKRYNPHLYSEELRRGERIRIPRNLPSPMIAEDKVVVNPEGNPLGLTVKEHVVLPKETKYGISRKYNITIEELDRLNPGVDNLRTGMVLKIANGTSAEMTLGKPFKYYQVQPKETLYSLTARLGISKDSLVVLNPALKEGLKAGMVLKIPDTEAGAVSEYAEDGLVHLEDRINDYEPKELVVMLPFGLDKIITTDSTSNATQRIKRDRVLQISLDFYDGILMAIDSARALGLSTNVRVFDTKQSAYEVSSLIARNNFNGVDAIIGPLLQSTAEAAAGKLQGEGVPVVSPLTKKETNYWGNFVQARPTDEMLEDAMISYISENAAGVNIIIIADPAKGEIKGKLTSAFPNSRTVSTQDGSSVDRAELTTALVPGRPNWVILESDKIPVISSVTSSLNSLSGEHEIVLLTTNKNNSYDSDNVSNSHLSRLKFRYPSVDKEFDGNPENPFIASYIKEHGVMPNTYVVRGFDVTFDVLLRLASAEDLLSSLDEEGTTEYAENKFDYEKGPSGSYVNKAIYILSYDENMKLKVIK